MSKVKNIEEYKLKKIKWDYDFVQTDKNGYEYPINSKENIKILLDSYGIIVRFNLLTKRMEIKTNYKICCENLNSFVVEIKDLITKHKFKGELAINRVNGILESIAWDNRFNPIYEYFKTLDYKKSNSLEEVTKMFDLLPLRFPDHREFYFNMYLKWLRHFIIAHFEDEFRPQLCLILKGKQRSGKSTWIRNLIPPQLRKIYFHDKQLNFDSKDCLSEITTKMLVEIGELGDSFQDINKIKMFMTQDKDEMRTPYATYANIHKRYTVFAGTVNDDEFLRDETGNTRFPVIEIDKNLNFKALNDINNDKFWSEVLYNYFNISKVHYLEGEEVSYINELNQRYKKYSYELSLLESVFDFENNKKTKYWLKSCDIWRILGKKQRVSKNRITRELKACKGIITKEKNRHLYFALNKPYESDLPKDFEWIFEVAVDGYKEELKKDIGDIITLKNQAINYIKSIIETNELIEFKSVINDKEIQLELNRDKTVTHIIQQKVKKNLENDKKYEFVFDLSKVNLNMNYPTRTVCKLYLENNVLVSPECKESENTNMIRSFYKKLNIKPGMTYDEVDRVINGNKKESSEDSM